MQFKVSYRGNDGAMHEIRIEATNRTECIRECNSRNIQPVRIAEGKSNPPNKTHCTSVRKPKSKQIVATALIFSIISVCIICLYILFPSNHADETKSIRPAKRGTEVSIKRNQIPLKPNNAIAPRNTDITHNTDVIANRHEQHVISTPSNRVAVIENDATNPEHRSDYSSGVEQVMGWIFTTEPGDLPPPLPDLSSAEKKRIVEIIIAKEKIYEDDTSKSIEAKEMVSAAKKELMSYLKQGGDVDGFLAFYKNELDKAHDEREESKRMLRDLAKEGDDELTVQFLKEVNERLAGRGIKALELPKKVKRRIEASKEK